MARKVAAELTLEAAQYLAEARLVEQRTAATDREMGQLDRSIDAVDRDLAELMITSRVAAKEVDNLGDQARGTGRDFSALEARIAASKARINELNMEIASTGGADRDLFKQLKSEQSGLRELERVAKAVTPDAGGGSGAATRVPAAASTVESGLGRASLSNPYLLAAAATVVVTTAPAVGAMIGGLLAGAIGTVGVAGGLAAAAKNPQVQAEASRVGHVIATEFFRAGDAFVEPALRGLATIEQAFLKLDLPATLRKVSPDVEIIVKGFADLATNIMPGLNKAFDRMGPFARVAATGFADLGDALSDFLDNVTASPGAIEGLNFAFNFLNQTIIGTGRLIHFLSDVFDVFINTVRNVAHLGAMIQGALGNKVLHDFFAGIEADAARMQNTTLPGIEDAARGAATGIGVFGQAIDRATEETNIFNKAIDKTYSAFLDFTGSSIAAEAAIDDLADAFKEHGTTLDVDTKAGRENLSLLKQLAESAMDATRKKLTETHSVQEANAVYDTYRQKLYDTFIQAGKTAEEAQILVDKWLALDQLADIDKYVTIHQTTYRVTYGSDAPTYGAGFQEFAEGGTVLGPYPGAPVMVKAHAGEEILTQEQQAQPWNGGYGAAREISVVVDVRGGDDDMKKMVRKWVRIDGAGSVQTAFGKN